MNTFSKLFLLSLCMACTTHEATNDRNEPDTSQDHFLVEMSIGEGSLACMMTFNDAGEGQQLFGYVTVQDSGHLLLDVSKKYSFSISDPDDQKKINQLIFMLRDRPELVGEHHWDAFRRIVFISKVKKVDVYGWMKSPEFEEVFCILSPYLPFDCWDIPLI